jgi:hypothetical protein
MKKRKCPDTAKTGTRRINKTALNKSCETEWKAKVKSGGVCQKCGRPQGVVQLHAAHIYPKGLYRNHPIKWDVLNGLALCYHCHFHWAHKHPIEFTHWFEEKYPERAAYLRERSLKIEKIDLEATLAELKGE